MKTTNIFFLLLFALIFSSCAEEVARISVNKISDENSPEIKTLDYTFAAGEEYSFWGDMDMEFDGNVELIFIVNILKDGEQITTLQLNPEEANVTMNSKEFVVNQHTKKSFQGKMYSFPVTEGGNYTIETYLLETSGNSSLELRKAELVIKL